MSLHFAGWWSDPDNPNSRGLRLLRRGAASFWSPYRAAFLTLCPLNQAKSLRVVVPSADHEARWVQVQELMPTQG